jgi:hypothetical protein
MGGTGKRNEQTRRWVQNKMEILVEIKCLYHCVTTAIYSLNFYQYWITQRGWCHQRENGELTVLSLTGENEGEKKQWNKKRRVILIEIFMYFGNAYILSNWNNCILHAVRHTYYISVKNSLVNESLSNFFGMKTRFDPLVACLEILYRYCRLTYESPLTRKRNVSANLSWTEMAFLNAVSFFETLFSTQMN